MPRSCVHTTLSSVRSRCTACRGRSDATAASRAHAAAAASVTCRRRSASGWCRASRSTTRSATCGSHCSTRSSPGWSKSARARLVRAASSPMRRTTAGERYRSPVRVPPSRNSMIRMLSGPSLVVGDDRAWHAVGVRGRGGDAQSGVGGRDARRGQLLRLELGGREGGVRDLHDADRLAARPGEEVLVLLAAERGQLDVEPPLRADDLRDLGDREVRARAARPRRRSRTRPCPRPLRCCRACSTPSRVRRYPVAAPAGMADVSNRPTAVRRRRLSISQRRASALTAAPLLARARPDARG